MPRAVKPDQDAGARTQSDRLTLCVADGDMIPTAASMRRAACPVLGRPVLLNLGRELIWGCALRARRQKLQQCLATPAELPIADGIVAVRKWSLRANNGHAAGLELGGTSLNVRHRGRRNAACDDPHCKILSERQSEGDENHDSRGPLAEEMGKLALLRHVPAYDEE